MSQNPYDAQRPDGRTPPTLSGELVPLGYVDSGQVGTGARSYDPLAGSQHQAYAPVQPYGPPPGHPGMVMPPAYLPAQKSVGVAFVLTFFFGPLGMLYSTVGGALVMIGIDLVLAVLTGIVVFFISLITLGIGSVLVILAPLVGIPTWIVSMIWGCVAASKHNEHVRAQLGMQFAAGAQSASAGQFAPGGQQGPGGYGHSGY
ncbi:hypothetical protein [Brachybacterium sp. AOP3-A1-3]|uniref:hypothetical protein n=1 Tax=Brachybacterium sp. AOP3-A1-3 TaxID=3457699 RepID=UPI0040346396